METIRQKKIQSLILQEISEVFREEGAMLAPNTMLTVTKVSITKDLSIARIYISMFGSTNHDQILENIRNNHKQIRYKLGLRIGKQVRIIPELRFFEDDSLDYIEKIESLIKE